MSFLKDIGKSIAGGLMSGIGTLTAGIPVVGGLVGGITGSIAQNLNQPTGSVSSIQGILDQIKNAALQTIPTTQGQVIITKPAAPVVVDNTNRNLMIAGGVGVGLLVVMMLARGKR